MIKSFLISILILLSATLFSSDYEMETNSYLEDHEKILNSIVDTISVFPYIQSFEGNQYWIVGGVSSSWELGIPGNNLINSASDGQKAWVTGLSASYNLYEKSWVESPVFDFSYLVSPVISFDILYDCEEFEDGACLEYSLDNGVSWFHVGQSGDPDNWYNSFFVANLFMTNSLHGWTGNPLNVWHQASHDLSLLSGEPAVKFRFYFGASQNLNMLEGFAFDNIVISDIMAIDIGISSLLFPVNDCVLSDTENIVIEITNYGFTDVSDYNVSFQLNGDTVISELIEDSLLSGSSFIFTFSNTIDLTNSGQNVIFISVDLVGDQAVFNDTSTFILNLTEPLALPYIEDFESGALSPGWSLSQESGSDGWLIGTNLGSTYFDVPPHTFYAASNDDTCYCNMSNDMLISPPFDFSSLISISLQFDTYISGFYGSSGKILASTDCGYTWEHVQYVMADTFYWQTQIVDLSLYAGFSSVKLAFHHNDNGGWAAGFAVDNILLDGIPFIESQNVELREGWGLMSTFIDPLEPLIDSVFSEVSSNLVILKDGFGNVYWPYYELNMIGNHSVGAGYQYNMNQADSLIIFGDLVTPEIEIINLPVGWSILGYLRNVPGQPNIMLNTIVSDIVLMKDEEGYVFWPIYNVNMIGSMNPGKGYFLNMVNSAILTYPAN